MGGCAGGCGAGSGTSGTPGDMSQFIKSGQRSSPSFKTAWQAYCTGYGTPKFDPSVYDREFLAGFAEYLGGLAAKDLGAEAELDAGQKRVMPFAGGTAKRIKSVTMGSLDPLKAELVTRVKNVQRSVEGGKEAWGNFCDMQCGGIRDPAKNENQA